MLAKRGMKYKLEPGGGAFNVDAISGWDLYDSGPAVDTKVVTTEQEEFNQLAFAARRRNNNGANFASGEILKRFVLQCFVMHFLHCTHSNTLYLFSTCTPSQLPWHSVL